MGRKKYFQLLSISFDFSTKQTRIHLKVRLRVYHQSEVKMFHHIALVMFDRYSENIIAGVLEEFCGARLPDWKSALIGLTTHERCTMTGLIHGVVKRLEQQGGASVVPVCCRFHYLHSVVPNFFEWAFEKTFLSLLTNRIGYLRRQQNLVSEMRSECPNDCTVRWKLIGNVPARLILHRVAVTE